MGCVWTEAVYDPAIASAVSFIEGLFVLSQYRSQGVAMNLAIAAEVAAKLMGAREGVITCKEGNTDILRVAEKMGFEGTHRVLRRREWDVDVAR